jgi:Ras-related protein Rab-5C
MNQLSKKVVIVGDSSVGKTSILFRFVFDKFDEHNLPTLGAGFKTQDVPFIDEDGREGKTKMNLWDTAG